MPAYDVRIMNKVNPNWAEMPVDMVTFPCPPTKAKGVFYAFDSWSSDALDRREVFNTVSRTCLGAVFTTRGPAFLVRTSLGSLFTRDQDKVVVPAPIYCATVSFQTLFESQGTLYATATILERVSEISGSCHPASHTVVPGAPHMTLLLLLSYAHRVNDPDFVFSDHLHAERLFPDHDFSGNRAAEQLFSYVTVSHALIKPKVDEIVVPRCLSAPAREVLLTTAYSNQHLFQMYPDPSEYVDMVDARNRRLKGE